MHSSHSSTACSTPTNDSIEKVIRNDAVRYQRKGYGLISSVLLTVGFFYLVPNFFKAIWPYLLNNVSQSVIFVCFAFGLHTGVVALSNVVMYVIYKIKLPFFERYRIHEKPWPWEDNPQLWREILRKTFRMLSISHFVIVPVMVALELVQGVKMRMDYESFPGIKEILGQVLFFMFCEDFFFYWAHRLLHHPKLYPYIHKIHHEYNITVSIAAEYAHPLEFLFGNLLATNSGPKILGGQVHFVTYCIWIIIRLMETTDGHCGYEFSWSPYRLLPLSGSSIYHNFHHSHNVGNYGSFFTFWDTLCGTNSHFYKYLANREKKQLAAKMQPAYNKIAEKINTDARLAKERENALEKVPELREKIQ